MSVTIVTGASKGIGKSIVEILLSNPNAKVIAVARSELDLQKIQDQHGSERVAYIAGDVSEESIAAEAVKLAVSKFGGVNAIIANAGVLAPVAPIDKVSVDDWKRLFDINYYAVIHLVQHSLEQLKKSSGKVVVVSSGASVKSYSGWYAYGGSKAALNHLVLSLAEQEKGISAISIAPGVVDTPMQQDIREKHGGSMSAEGHKRFLDLHKNKELVKPEVPATVLANLALRGWDSSINGKYLRYNDEQLKEYTQ
ncbi:NAD(P)-binding protein [Suhomyces tanzawaensis NRRL Y-17324]|uniref:NAD(P)-binding protein n=1 Tax=Suhomyces tanzawaensis NRRL Y-17324 TaxID=984487 RepID=A0A1E4SN03_9ASCO|nr:NAD(P)-binding protein [Suhomyces tanzawaensis NRRL Y-17324]ODV80900.1 NAD(P)-binding protein [Suhomyces tanzawaensis NRRL Y-17324]